jgi:hypothetical protein
MNPKIEQAMRELERHGYQREAQRAYQRWAAGERFDLQTTCDNRDALLKSSVKAANQEATR